MPQPDPLTDNAPDDLYTQEPGLGAMLRRLTDDASQLVRHEIGLVKLELKEATTQLSNAAVRFAVAFGLALLGLMALTAALILGIGAAFDGLYWVAALVVGVVYLGIGGLLARLGASKVQDTDLTPERTIKSLKEDKRWASREARDFKDGVLS